MKTLLIPLTIFFNCCKDSLIAVLTNECNVMKLIHIHYKMRIVRLVLFFGTRLEMGGCLVNASCRSWRVVMRLGILSCFSNAS